MTRECAAATSIPCSGRASMDRRVEPGDDKKERFDVTEFHSSVT
jgi:hypothetical protein